MKILVAVFMILGGAFVLVVGLLSVLHDLLVRTTGYEPSELDLRDPGDEIYASYSGASEDLQ